jgi:hypothetical protein
MLLGCPRNIEAVVDSGYHQAYADNEQPHRRTTRDVAHSVKSHRTSRVQNLSRSPAVQESLQT